ncbi:MAG: hypothetical protein BroJett018_21960 [Chloroflexota bacterium]|nr:hypothetical protein [Chloroflexota bacterium]GIK64402.1 MAG: hypothetical protein BroJett018_21960 [Chloroflexota bacterium]
MKRMRLVAVTLLVVLLLAFPSAAFAQVPNPSDWIDDLTQAIQFMIDGFWYDLLALHAQIQWFVMKVFFILGIVIDLMTDFMAEHAFAPLITQSNSQFGIAVSMSFTIAMLVLGMSYMIAHFIRFNVVEFKSALTWYLLAALFFQLGPELYLSMNQLRSDINSFFYATALQTVNNSGSPLAPLNNNMTTEGLPMLPPCDNFGWLTGQPTTQPGAGVDGLDIAMSYMLATSEDVLGQPPAVFGNCRTPNPGGYENNLPFRWYYTDGYFDVMVSPDTWEVIPADDRERSLSMAAAAQYRLIGAWPLLWLGIFEKIVYLLVAFAQGLSFISFGVAAIFAFFKRTEGIARSVVDLWIEIIVASVVIALGQSLIVSLALAAAATQNPLASIGVGLLCAVLMLILMISAMKLVWNSLTRIFGSISQATGGAILTPGQVAAGAAVGTVGTAAAIATGGGTLALAGAAMSGMSASGIGGPAMNMAGGQLMMAGRMTAHATSGAGRAMTGGSSTQTLPPPFLELGEVESTRVEPLLLSSGPSSSGNGPTGISAPLPTPPLAPPPINITGYEPEDLLPDSSVGRRTSRIQARFTPADESATAARMDATEQAHLNADNERDDAALSSALNTDNRRDESAAQAQMDADNSRDDAVLRDTLKTIASEQKVTVDTAGLERAGRDLSAAAGALKTMADQQQRDRVAGRMDVTGSRNVGAVVADAVDMEREYRQKMDKPMLDGAGDQFGGRMAQSVGMQPAVGQTPISDAARFNAVGDQALRLGLNGGHIMQVLQEQASAEDGRSVQPATHDKLVQYVRMTTGTRQSEAQQQVGRFLTVAAAMPDEVRITGSIPQTRLGPTAERNTQPRSNITSTEGTDQP